MCRQLGPTIMNFEVTQRQRHETQECVRITWRKLRLEPPKFRNLNVRTYKENVMWALTLRGVLQFNFDVLIMIPRGLLFH